MDTYKIDRNNIISLINDDTFNFAYKLHIEDRFGKFKMKDSDILFKDHNPNFENKLLFRLINPSKTESLTVEKGRSLVAIPTPQGIEFSFFLFRLDNLTRLNSLLVQKLKRKEYYPSRI